MSAMGATAAQAADLPIPPTPTGWFTDSTECTFDPNNVTIPGTVQLPPNTADYTWDYYVSGTARSVVLRVTPVSPNTFDGSAATREVQEHYWKVTECPRPPEPTPTPTPEQQETVAPAPAKTTNKTTVKAPTRSTTTAPTPTTTKAVTEPTSEPSITPTPDTTTDASAETVEPSTAVEPPPTAESMTTASDVQDGGGNLIIPIGGAVLLASAIGTLGYGVGKLGWFRR